MLGVELFFVVFLCLSTYVSSATHSPCVDHVSRGGTIRDSFTLRESFYHGLNGTGFLITGHTPNKLQTTGTEREPPKLLLRSQQKHSKQSYATSDKYQIVMSSDSDDRVHGSAFEPNITDKETVVNLAKMTSNSYFQDPSLAGWSNLSSGFNLSQSFGWQMDGLRGHVFANGDNSTVVVSFKGTTTFSWTGTRPKDRENDNILFSCCCATQRKDPYPYGSVCGCRSSTFSCNGTCLTQEVAPYPKSHVWVVGHSLGGAIASLMRMTFDIPAVTFESPPDLLPAQRLGLALPPAKLSTTYHFGNTADPVYVGACNGYTASCAIAGYAFESQCFSGKRCVYDTVIDKGWHVNVLNHQIESVINNVLMAYDTVANCTVDDECVDCYNWNFYD